MPRIATVKARRFKVDEKSFLLHKQEASFATHSGTHLDAMSHLIAGSPTVDLIPLENLVGAGAAVSVSRGPFEPISASDLRHSGVPVRRGDIVLIHTHWDKKVGSDDYYIHPHLAEDAAAWLVEKGVKVVGLDTPTPEVPRSVRGPGFDYPIHRLLLGSGVLVLENVANLCPLSGRRLTVGIFPLKLEGGDGAPARVIARVR